MTTITAQDLYDWRERTGAISGTDLHNLFRTLLDGEPSPPGRTILYVEEIQALADAGDTLAQVALKYQE